MNDLFEKYCGRQFSYQQIFFLVILITTLRILVEWCLFEFPIQLNIFQDYVRFYLENVYYFLIVFLAGAVAISLIGRIALKEVMNFGARLYPVIILPPLIDGLLLGRKEGYYYATMPNMAANFFTLSFIDGDATLGISIEILIGLIGIFSYVCWKTKKAWKGIICALVINAFLVVISTPDLIFGEGRGDYYSDYFLPCYYFLPFLLYLSLALHIYSRDKFYAILGNIRIARSLIFIFAVFLGGTFTNYLGLPKYFLKLSCGALAIFFVWQVSIIVNDIFDVSIDSVTNRSRPLVTGIITVQGYWLVTSIFSFLALSFAVVVSLKVFILIVAALIMAHLYSSPPMRLRKNLFGNILIGIALFLSFWVGIFASGYYPVAFQRAWFLSGLIFIFGAALSMTKDIKDIEGDAANNIENLFTIYGKKHGKRIATGLAFIVFNIPTVVCSSGIIFLLSLLAAGLYYKFESIKSVYIIGAVIFFMALGYVSFAG